MKAITPPRTERPRLDPSKATVLLVDDRTENLVALEGILEGLNLNLLRATSGDDALKALLRHDIALILMDVQMPGLDGFETAAYIKQLEKTRHIPIIFLTAISKEARNVFRGYSAGAVDYLFKPFDPDVLRSKVAVFVDLHEKKKALQESEERFRKAFDHAPIGVALVGLRGHCIESNVALCEMLGYEEKELAALTIRDITHPDEPEIDLAHLRKALADGAAFHAERRFVRSDGSELDALVGVSFIAGARDPHFILQVTDVSEKKRLEEFRERFVANAAHELRTPVAVISGTASVLKKDLRGWTPEQLEGAVLALDRQSQRLVRLVDSLLDLTRLQDGRLKTHPEKVVLRDLVDEIVEAIPAPDETKVSATFPDDLAVMMDKDALDQMITNLLVNAFRYGGPNVFIDAERKGDEVFVRVRDDGEGVPDELVARLFEPFTRGPSSVKVGGSGLGLALVKSLTEATGATIAYERDDGFTSFVLRMAAAG